MRRLFLALLAASALLPAGTPGRAKPPAIRTAAIRWPGAEGRTVHGYMAIPAKARGRQPAVLVLADGAAGGQLAAHALVDALARAGILACTPRGDEPEADLAATVGWLRASRYATGRVALVALGAGAVPHALPVARPDALLILANTVTAPPSGVPTLVLPPPGTAADLPPEATAFLKEHLR